MCAAADDVSTSGLWSCGILGKVHGLHGELYLNLAVDGLDHLERGVEFFLARPGLDSADGTELLIPCAVTRAGGTPQRPLLRVDAASTREEAVALQGCELLATGGELDELPHYRVGDVIGLRVETASGRSLGVVDDVLEAPAHEIIQVRVPDGTALLVPLVPELVTVDDAARVARIVDGLLDEPADETAAAAPAGAAAEAPRADAEAP